MARQLPRVEPRGYDLVERDRGSLVTAGGRAAGRTVQDQHGASHHGATPDPDIRVLGHVEALVGGTAVRLGGRKQRIVLALLVAEVGHVVSVDALIDGVWGERPTRGARSTLQTYVSNLRSEFGDVIVHDGAGYRLGIDPQCIDAVRFADAVERTDDRATSRPAEVAERLRRAQALWRGHPYADVQGPLALDLEARRLESLRVRGVERRVEAELALGMHRNLLAELEVLCAEFPLHEPFTGQHMLALYRSGRQADALRAFTRTQQHLVEELGIDTSPQLRDLHRRILEQDPSLLPAVEPHVQVAALLLTDLDATTETWERHPDAFRTARDRRDRVVGDAVTAAGGRIVERAGDVLVAVFADIEAAVRTAEQTLRTLDDADRRASRPRTRIAIDLGEVEVRGGDHAGPVRTRCARILAAAHGGQAVLSGDAQAALAATGAGWTVHALGPFRFAGMDRPVPVFQLRFDGLQAEFPALLTDRLPTRDPSAAQVRTIRGFELRERAGSGALGTVFRAYQPAAGREVAVRIIHPGLVNRPSFVRRFEANARRIAQLDHPHVAPLYDHWRDPDGAYLVTRWLPGGSLQAAIDRGPWNLEPATRLVEQVAGALAHAHRNGVVHGRVRPKNVLLDDEGAGYLVDFPVATEPIDVPGSADEASPHLAPELLAGQPPTPRSDLYGLGLLTFELLTGQRSPTSAATPPVTALRTDLPAALDGVIAAATTAAPEHRSASVEQWLDDFREAAGTPALSLGGKPARVRNPYKGLRAFAETDAADFHGRTSVVGDLVAAVGRHRLVGVVGPSGIGKSSVVRAGLVPALRAASPDWLVTEMVPGAHPFEELANALLPVAVERPDSLVEELSKDELGIRRVAREILLPGSDLLLVIDQFEELFTLTASDEVRRRFLDGLVRVAEDAGAKVRVVLTLRADHLDHPLRYAEFGALLGAGMVTINAPSDDELAEAIQAPAESQGVRYASDLVSRIIADVHDQPGALPLLQYALTELFETRTSNLVELDHYRATGGVIGALGLRAEELYAGLDPDSQAAVRQMFLRLVSIAPDGQVTRRRVRRRELRALELVPTVLEGILARFGAHRLLTFDREPLTRSPTVEVAHEAIVDAWGRLRTWIDERRADLLLHQRLLDAISEWTDAERMPDYLPSGARLGQLEDWAATTDLVLTADERAFLAAARSAADEAERRRTRRRHAILVGFAGLALVASVLAAFAFVQQGRAEQQARLASARALAAAAQDALQDDPELSLLLALAGVDETAVDGDVPLPEVIEALHAAVNAHRILLRTDGPAQALSWSPTGDLLALAPGGGVPGADGGPDAGATSAGVADPDPHHVQVIDPATGALRSGLAAEDGDGPVTNVLFDATGTRLVTTHAGDGPTAIAWDVSTGQRRQVLVGHGETAVSPALTPDGTHLALFNDDGSLSMWDLEAATERYRRTDVQGEAARIKDFTGAAGIDIRGAGDMLVTAEPGLPGAVVRQVSDGAVIHELRTPFGETHVVAFSPDGTRVAVLEALPGAISLFDVATGALLERIPTGGSLLAMAWSPDGSAIAVAGNDATITLVDPDTGTTTLTLRGHAEPVVAVAFSPDGTGLASAGIGASTLVWDLTATGRGQVGAYPTPIGHKNLVSADGSRVYAAFFGTGTIQVLDGRTLGVLDTISEQYIEWPAAAALSPDGRWLASTGRDQVPRVRDAVTLEVVQELPAGLHVLAFDPAGDRVLVDDTGSDGTYQGPPRVLDVASGREAFRLDGTGRLEGFGAEFSHDGRLLATASFDGRARVHDATSGTLLAEFPLPQGLAATSVAFHPDGTRLAISSNGGMFLVADVAAARAGRAQVLETVPLRSGTTNVMTLRYARGGEDLIAGGLNSEIGVWDAATLEHRYSIRTAVASAGMLLRPSGIEVLNPVAGPGTVAYTLEIDQLVAIARERLTRPFTLGECRRYLHMPDCPP